MKVNIDIKSNIYPVEEGKKPCSDSAFLRQLRDYGAVSKASSVIGGGTQNYKSRVDGLRRLGLPKSVISILDTELPCLNLLRDLDLVENPFGLAKKQDDLIIECRCLHTECELYLQCRSNK